MIVICGITVWQLTGFWTLKNKISEYKMESKQDRLSRLGLMASGNPKWDLSDHDIQAIKYAVDFIKSNKGKNSSTVDCYTEQSDLLAEITFYKGALRRIANEFGITDPVQLVIEAESEEENYVDILIRIIKKRLGSK